MTILGTSSTSGLVPGIIAMIVELIVMVLVLNVMIRRACSKGEVFRMGPFDHLPREDKEEPNALISLIPLAVLFVLFNVVHLPIVFAMFAAAFCSAVLFFRYIPRGKFRRTINEGFVASLTPVGSIGAVFAFASVVQKTDAFSKIVEMLLGMEIHSVSSWQPSRLQEAMEYCKRMNYRGPSVSSPEYSLVHAKYNRWPGTWYADDEYAQWHKEHDIALFAWASQGIWFADTHLLRMPWPVGTAQEAVAAPKNAGSSRPTHRIQCLGLASITLRSLATMSFLKNSVSARIMTTQIRATTIAAKATAVPHSFHR